MGFDAQLVSLVQLIPIHRDQQTNLCGLLTWRFERTILLNRPPNLARSLGKIGIPIRNKQKI